MLKLINLDQICQSLPEITSPKFFIDSKMTKLDPDGLFSEVIFGPPNSKEWRTRYGKITLKSRIFNPIIFRLLKRLNKKLIEAINNYERFDILDDGSIHIHKDGKLRGLSDLIENFDLIKFKQDPNSKSIRNKLIEYISNKENYDKIFISYILVIPPQFRPIYNLKDPNKDKNGLMYDEINDYYIKLIKNVQTFPDISDKTLKDSYDLKIQLIVNEFYEYIKLKIGKKTGYLRGNLVSKRVEFSGRSVIIGNPKLKATEIGIPLKMAVNLFRPFILHIWLNHPKPEWWEQETESYLKDYSIQTFNVYLDMIAKGYKISNKIYELIWNITKEAMKNRYVLAKRDPSIRRESWMGYVPVLVDGDAIQINMESTSVHNADFDGDTVLGLINLLIRNKKTMKNDPPEYEQIEINILNLKDLTTEKLKGGPKCRETNNMKN